MNEKLRKVLSDAANGNNDLWKKTEVAAELLIAGGYPGHNEDLECLEDIEDCIELENLLSRGSWYFQETRKWKDEFETENEQKTINEQVEEITQGERVISLDQLNEIKEIPTVYAENCGSSGTGEGTLVSIINENDDTEICEVIVR